MRACMPQKGDSNKIRIRSATKIGGPSGFGDSREEYEIRSS
jgi:hypothetical protein